MIPIIPIVAAVTATTILIKRKLNSHKSSLARLIDYVKSKDINVDTDGCFDADTIQDDGIPLLFDVMYDTKLFTTLLDYGANPDICNSDGTPAIIFALNMTRAEEIIRILLKYGANPNAMDSKGKTTIFYAKTRNTIQQLLDAGADTNAQDSEGIPLLFDVMYDTELLTTLLDYGANPDICNSDGTPAIIFALNMTRAEEIIKILLKYGANPNAMDSKGKTTIFYAKTRNTIQQLLDAGADINAQDSDGTPAIIFALNMNRAEEIIRILLKYGANPNAMDSKGKTTIFYAKTRNTIQLLLDAGADINAQDSEGKTAIFYAAASDINFLSERGADINVRDKDGKTFLFYFSGPDDFDIIEELQENGLNVDVIDYNGETFKYHDEYIKYYNKNMARRLNDAVESNNINKVRKLLANGANPNIWDKHVQDWSMIHLAISRHNPEMIEVLASGGADINAQRDGIPPLSKAIYDNNYDCFKMLLELGADTELSKNAVTYSGTNQMKELFKKKLKKKQAPLSKLLDYVKSLSIPIDDDGSFNPNAVLEDGKPILFDVMSDIGLFTALLEYGANPDICNTDGVPAIIYAVTRPYSVIGIISTLLEYGANPNATDSDGKTIIFHTNLITILKQIIDAGGKLNAVDHTGKTALYDAIINCNYSYAWTLCRLGADVNARDCEGKSILFYISSSESFDLIKSLQRYGLNIDAVDNQGHKFEYYDSYLRYLEEIGNSPKTQNLYNAVNSNNISEVRRWLAKGANPNIWDKAVKDWSMIHLAISRHNPEMIEVLALGGADINAQRDGIPPLSKAIYDNNYDCFKMLLELGADTELSKIAVEYSGTPEMKELFKKYTK